MKNLYSFSVKGIDGKDMPLSQFEGKVTLIVNVASKCGLTPQYKGLEAQYRAFKAQGFELLGLPCNQFLGQEPGAESEIQQFCSVNYDVTFPLTSKIEVNGPNRHELYQWLAGPEAAYPGDIIWNFEKFLVNKAGNVVARFSPKTDPGAPELTKAIERALA